jgi:Ca2+:H+ antiporter
MSSKPTNHTADETSPLINGGASSALHDTLGRRNGNGSGNGHISLSRDSSTMTFLFDSKHTPGIHNQNIAIRSLAYSWHIAKVTLLSSTFAPLHIHAHIHLTLLNRLCQLSSGYGASRHHRW